MNLKNELLLQIKNATKMYNSIIAIQDINFDLHAGEVHCLIGENGAGKSTLMKCLSGNQQLTSGEIYIDGKKMVLNTPKDGFKAGIAMVYQETSLAPYMTVAQNIYLGKEKFLNGLRSLYIAAQQVLQSMNFNVDPTVTVDTLGTAQMQMVEIAKSAINKAKLYIFDEPTATLTPEEKQHFFDLVRMLKKQNAGIVFITHALEEALTISDRITVLRDGRHIMTKPTQELDRDTLVRSMVGRDLSDEFLHEKTAKSKNPKSTEKILSVENLTRGKLPRNNTFSVYTGLVTGIFGLVGSGRTETAKIICGALKRNFFNGGEVFYNGKSIRYRVPAQAIADGIVYVTEDRKAEGFFEAMSIADNIYAGYVAGKKKLGILVSRKKRAELATEWGKRLNIKSINLMSKVIELSGGNQQKVVIAKSLTQNPKLVIFDEPTRGVDVAAIKEIHELIRQLADDGIAIVVISSYLPEILNISDRVLVMRQGRVVEEFDADQVTEEKIMYASVH
jgi:simple sugar transport system ATP-binding protein